MRKTLVPAVRSAGLLRPYPHEDTEYSLQQVQAQVDKAKETLETIRKGLKADTARKFPIFSSKTNKVIGYGTDHRTRH